MFKLSNAFVSVMLRAIVGAENNQRVVGKTAVVQGFQDSADGGIGLSYEVSESSGL